MAAKRGSRTILASAVSAGLHALVLAVLATQAPRLIIPDEPGGPPEPIIPVLLAPRLPPPPGAQRPSEVKLHRRPLRFAVAPPPIAPLPAPPSAPAKPASPGPVILHPAPLPEGPEANVRAALRASVGCANRDNLVLTREEREKCDEQLGRLALHAPVFPLGLSPDKQRAFDEIAARKEADRRYREAPAVGAPPGPAMMEPWRAPPDPHAKPDLPRLPP